MTKDLYQQVTDTILNQLKKGVAPWIKPWKDRAGSSLLPVNKITGKPYNGVNIVLLWGSTEEQGFQTNEWASFKQWSDKKEFVRKGEKGTMIVFYDTIEKEKEDGEIHKIFYGKTSYVFNRAQLKSYEPEKDVKPELEPLHARIEAVDMFVRNTGANIEVGGNLAAYIPKLDKIVMPPLSRFVNQKDCTATEAFYSTEFHELIHFTGHPTRLNRELSTRFGNKSYAKEELTAELGAAFLGAEFQIEKEPVMNHAAYIKSWSKSLKDEPKTFITAASQASKAVAYLHGERHIKSYEPFIG